MAVAHASPQDLAEALPVVLNYGRPVMITRDGESIQWKLSRDRAWKPLNEELFQLVAARLDFSFPSDPEGAGYIWAPAVLHNRIVTQQCLLNAIHILFNQTQDNQL